VQLVVP